MKGMNESTNNLKHLTECPVCNKKYQHTKTFLLEEDEARTTFHLTCGNCKTSILVFVSSGQFGVISLGVATDMSGSEARRLFRNDSISADNVIKVHELLREHKGGIKELI